MLLALCPGVAYGAAAVGTASGTAGYNYIAVSLTSGGFSATASDVTELSNWNLTTNGGQSITSITKQSATSVRLDLNNPIEAGNTLTLQANANVFAAGTEPFAAPIAVTITVPIVAQGTATATAGTKDITVQLTNAGFATAGYVETISYWTLGGASAGGNPIVSVTRVSNTEATITLTNEITASDTYTITASQYVFPNIATAPFATPLTVTISGGGDTTPPAFEAGKLPTNYPQMAGSRQIYICFTAQEPAYYHAVLLPDGAAEPSQEQVAAGQDASGNAAIRVYKNNKKETNMTIVGFVPLHGTDYDVYVVLKDDAGNLSDPEMVDFPSPPPADLIVAGYPAVGDVQPDGSKQVQIKVKLKNIQADRKGKVYWALLPDGASPPGIEQVAAGTDGSDNPAITCGSPEFSQGSEETFLVTGAVGSTAYDLYMVVGHTYYAYPLANCTDISMLDITTPADIPGEKVCAIGATEYGTLAEALNAAGTTATIKLLKSFTVVQTVAIENKNITFDLDGKTLTITTAANEGLKVTGGSVALTGAGALNVTGKIYGVRATSSNVTVTTATASDTDISGTASGMGVYAAGGSEVTVLGDATGAAHGVKAENASTKVVVNGNVSNSGQVTGAVHSAGQAEVLVKGNVTSSQGYGLHAIGGKITVEGNVSASQGAMTEDMNSQIIIWGDLFGYNNGAIVYSGNGTITVDGEISASLNYVQIGPKGLTKETGVDDPAKPGYLKYSDSTEGVTGAVWVKSAALPPSVKVSSITVSATGGVSSIERGKTLQMSAAVLPANAADKTVTWSVINGTGTATISGSGLLSATTVGTVTVKATANDGSGIVGTKEIMVTSLAVTPVSSITVSAAGGVSSVEKGKTLQMGASVLPADAADKTVTWSVVNGTGAATISNSGLLSATAVGAVTVKATANDGSGVSGSKNISISSPSSSGGSSGGGGSSTPAFSGTSVSDSGGTVNGAGATVFIPAYAVADTIKVRIERVGSSGVSIPTEMRLVSSIFDITKDKSGDFKRAVTITLPFEKEGVDAEQDELVLCWWDGSRWVKLDNISINWSAGTISGTIEHFTRFAVLAPAKAEPESQRPVVTRPPTPEPVSVSLNDISGHWAQAAIRELVAAGAIKGYPDGSFRPDQIITRAEFATVLVKALELPVNNSKAFADTTGHWAGEAISTAYAAGIISGYNNQSFGPDDPITREQMAVMVVRALRLSNVRGSVSFADSGKISPWAKEAVAAAYESQLISGYPDKTFRPGNQASRAEAVAIITRALK